MSQEPISFIQSQEDAIEQIKKRITIQFNLTDEAAVAHLSKRVFERAVFYAEKFHREHQRDDLPHEKVRKIDEHLALAFEWQDTASLLVLQNEQKMTLIGFFVAVGVERGLAAGIVDHIIERNK